jgi:hypothetical protein
MTDLLYWDSTAVFLHHSSTGPVFYWQEPDPFPQNPLQEAQGWDEPGPGKKVATRKPGWGRIGNKRDRERKVLQQRNDEINP